jgi:hypothetical protein
MTSTVQASPKKITNSSSQSIRTPVLGRPRTLTHEAIAVRAHELYEQSGYQPDREVEFWLEAERQLREDLDA